MAQTARVHTPLPIPASIDLQLPEAYVQRRATPVDEARDDGKYWTDERIAMAGRYQHHVYAWARSILEARGGGSVLDVGCGPGVKLEKHLLGVATRLAGVDQVSSGTLCHVHAPSVAFRGHDLERPMAAWEQFDLVICADVLEHLADPRPAAKLIRECAGRNGLVLLSTPDRDRLRGRGAMQCFKPDHVREWTASEFRRFARAAGLRTLRRRFFPQDDAPMVEGMEQELAWRAGEAETSPWACCTLLCEVGVA